MNDSRANEEEIFLCALDIADADHRENYIREACAGNDRLVARVRKLLAADAEERAVLASRGLVKELEELQPGARLGPFELVEKIGEGGMGVVFRAQQTSPVVRDVAVKVIRHGMDTKEVIARFRAEQQALALMDHPAIATVLEAGATPRGRPYFAMEYVPGEAITKYCSRQQLGTTERLRLFVQICDAVQHAHQKGVIHRDLKPSNVLVETREGQPVVRIIDFGVAKSTQSRLTEKTLFTEIGQIMGTLEYMSPEQADVVVTDVDTRADVYSLGVILYELLVGHLPFDPKQLRSLGFGEMQRILREVDPPKPSARLSTVSIDAKHHGTGSGSSTRTLTRRLRGDLDWVVMKSLEKDRERRYQTVAEFARDVDRHLSNEPVSAGPPAAGYRLRKFVQRNRGTVVAIGLVFVALAVGAGIASYAFVQEAKRAEELESVVAFQASQLAGIDVSATGDALRERFLDELVQAIEATPENERSDSTSTARIRELATRIDYTGLALSTLDNALFVRAIDTVEEKFKDQPLVQANLYQTLARTLHRLGLFDRAMRPARSAVELHRATLGRRHPQALRSVVLMGILLRDSGDLAGAQPLYEEAIGLSREVHGDVSSNTITCLANMGSLLRKRGDREGAERNYGEALQLLGKLEPPDDRLTASLSHRLGILTREQAKFDEALTHYQRALEIRRELLGKDHPHTLNTVNDLGLLFQEKGDLEKAVPYTREVLEASQRVLGHDHPDTLTSLSNLGLLLHRQGKFEEAEPIIRDAYEISERVLGVDHPDTVTSLSSWASLLRDLGRLDEAAQTGKICLERGREIFGRNHWQNGLTQFHYSLTLLRMERYAEATAEVEESYTVLEQTLGKSHPTTLRTLGHVPKYYNAWHKEDPEGGHNLKAEEWKKRLPKD